MHKTSYGSRGWIIAMAFGSLMQGLVVWGQDAATQRVYPIDELRQVAAIREAVWRADPHAKTTFDRAQGRVIVEGSAAAQDAALAVSQEETPAVDAPQAFDNPVAQPIADIPKQPVLRTMAVPAQHVRPISTAVGLRYRNTPGVQISPDRQKGLLLIMAPPELQDQIASDVESLLPGRASESRRGPNSTAASQSRQPLRVPLRGLGWQQFEDTLREFVGEKLPVTTSRNGELATFQLVGQSLQGTTVEVDRRANTVTVVAPQPAMAGWQQIIQSLDQSTIPAGAVAELIRVRNAEPAPIQRAIRLLGNFRPNETTAVAKAPQQEQDAKVRFQGAIFQQPQAQPPENGDTDVTIEGDVTVVEGDGGGGLIGDTQIEFVPELGVIIVKGSKRDVDRVMQVIEQIEAQSAVTQPEVEVYPLKHVNSQAIADLLDELYSEVLSARQGAVSITSLDKPNALLLIGRKEALGNVRNLIQELDQPVAPSTQLRVYRLENASALDAEETVRNFFSDQPGEEELRPGLGTRARVVADYRTNSLIVQASPRDLMEVTKLVQELDVEKVPSKNELKVIKLRNALAEDLAPVLQDAIHGESETENEAFTQPSTTLSIVSIDAEGNRLLDSGILAGAVITADANANALIVRASSSSIPLIEELIRQLDQPPGAESLVKVFTVENGDAVQLTTALQELFGTPGGAAGAGAGGPNLAGLAPTSAGESSLVSLRFSYDQRTNSIIASGSASDLEVVESLLLRLDTSGFAERVFEVIWLRNQFAPDVATALQQFVTSRFQQSQQIQQFQQGLGPYDALERDLVVVAEPTSNSLVISVAPRLYDTVRRVIDQLDRRAPMIMVKVLIAEITLTDGIEVGVEFGIQDSLLFDRGIAGTASNPGFNFNNAGLPNLDDAGRSTLAEQAVTAFGLGRTSQNFGYGGFVLSAASDSVSLLLRSLQDAGRLQILSRPQLMTLDNTEGLVQVGSLVPRVTSVSQGALGTGPTIATQDVEVGLILRVAPRVGRDGLIVMNVDATRSSVGDISQGIPVGFGPDGEVILSPQIEQTTAQSVITAFSGQTVVYGGLIQKQRTQTIRRVPLISDIPILGRLFRYDQESEIRNELLVVLTPMIVSGGEDLEYVKATESARMSWCLPEIVEMNGDVGLNGGHGLWGPAIAPVIYPDMQPTVDDFDLIHPNQVIPPGFHHEGAPPGFDGGIPPAFDDGVPPGMFPSEGMPVPAEGVVPPEEMAPPARSLPPPPPAPVQESVLESPATPGGQAAAVQPAAYNRVPRQASPLAASDRSERSQPPAGFRQPTERRDEMRLPAEWQNRLLQPDDVGP